MKIPFFEEVISEKLPFLTRFSFIVAKKAKTNMLKHQYLNTEDEFQKNDRSIFKFQRHQHATKVSSRTLRWGCLDKSAKNAVFAFKRHVFSQKGEKWSFSEAYISTTKANFTKMTDQSLSLSVMNKPPSFQAEHFAGVVWIIRRKFFFSPYLGLALIICHCD